MKDCQTCDFCYSRQWRILLFLLSILNMSAKKGVTTRSEHVTSDAKSNSSLQNRIGRSVPVSISRQKSNITGSEWRGYCILQGQTCVWRRLEEQADCIMSSITVQTWDLLSTFLQFRKAKGCKRWASRLPMLVWFACLTLLPNVTPSTMNRSSSNTVAITFCPKCISLRFAKLCEDVLPL